MFTSINNPSAVTINEANNIIDTSNLILTELTIKVKNLYDSVWNNPNATPAEIWSTLGTQGVSLIMAHYQTQLLLQQLNPNYVVLTAPVELKLNEDGTVEIVESAVIVE